VGSKTRLGETLGVVTQTVNVAISDFISHMVITTQYATCKICKKKAGCTCDGVKRILVDYK